MGEGNDKKGVSYRMDGRRMLITGASGGIGQACARILADLGALLTLSAIRPPPASLVLETGAWAALFDQTDRIAAEAALAAPTRFDVLIDTAGVCLDGDWMDPDWEQQLQRTFDINIRGTINVALAASWQCAQRVAAVVRSPALRNLHSRRYQKEA